jgi:hypothetical protein
MHMITLAAATQHPIEDPAAGVGKSECASTHRSTEVPPIASGSMTSAGVGNSAMKLIEIVGADDG